MRQKSLDAFGIENRFHCFSEIIDVDERAFEPKRLERTGYFGVVTDAVAGFLAL